MKNDNQSLSHTKWNCKYHIVFAPKYRRLAIYGRVREDTVFSKESRYASQYTMVRSSIMCCRDTNHLES